MTPQGTATTQQSEPHTVQIRYLPGLDGIRAFAVAVVMLYHAGYNLAGGYLGVESFFVLSGFLITTLLLAEWRENGAINLRRFWVRRARRLLPALLATLVGTLLFTLMLVPGELRALGSDILAALFYVMNLKLIVAQQSYFDPLSRPPLLQHLWSLAVEEQFYLLWPLLFAGGMRLLRPFGLLVAVLLAVLASTTLMLVLYDQGGDPSRVYYGTDTRAAALFIGVALAFIWTPERRQLLGPRAGLLLEVAGVGAFVGLLVAYGWLYEQHPLLYRGGFQLVALATALLVAATTHPAARWLPKLLEAQPLRWIGLRSYSLYLWHWPIFVLLDPGTDFSWRGVPLSIVAFGLVAALADLSYRIIERPIRILGVAGAWNQWRATTQRAAPLLTTRWRMLSLMLCVLLFTTLGAFRLPRQPLPVAATVAPTAVLRAATNAPIANQAVEQQPTSAASEQAAGPRGACDDAVQIPLRDPCAETSDALVVHTPIPPQSSPTVAVPVAPTLDPALTAELQQLLDTTVSDGYIPGAVLSVHVPGYAAWTGASGTANRDQGLAMTPNTPVRIASVSKMFTAVVVLQLVEEGVLPIDAPIATWLPDSVPAANVITVRQLLQHTSGLYDYLEDLDIIEQMRREPERVWQPQQLVDYATSFPAGRLGRWDYSSTNYVLLGMLVEQVTGQPLAQQMRQRIFEPLGMQQAAFLPQESVPNALARGYANQTDITDASMSFAFATGNLAMTADDLQRFGRALFTDELLQPETREMMMQFVSGRGHYGMPALAYGLGLMRNRLPIGPAADGASRSEQANLVFGHIGGYGGFRAALWYAPESDLVIALVLNQSQADPNEIANEVLDQLLRGMGR